MTPERSSGEWSLAVRQQASVAHLGQLGLQGGPLEDLLDQALAHVSSTLEVAAVALFEVDPTWRELLGRNAIVQGHRLDARNVRKLRLPAGRESMPGYTVQQGEAVVAPDLLNDPRFVVRAAEHALDAQAAITAPVGWGERAWGVLGVYSDVVRPWTDDDLHYVQSVANTIGLTIARERLELELRDSTARLDLSLDAVGLGSWTLDIRASTITLSAPALAIYGLSADEFDGTRDMFLTMVHAEDRPSLAEDAQHLVGPHGEHHNLYRFIRRDGSQRWIESWGRLLEEPDRPPRLVGVIADVTDRRQADDDRKALLADEKRARVEAESARERLAVLAEASALFSSSLDPEVIAASLPRFCVPLIADVCLVDLENDQGELVEVAAEAHEPSALADVRELRRRRAALGGVGGMWSERAVDGRAESVFAPRMTDQQFQDAASSPEHLALFRRFNGRSAMVVPMVARGRVIGVLTLIIRVAGREYDRDQLALVEELGARAALAIDNGRLFESRNRVARSLQAALLPPALPEVAGLELAARYRVAEGDIEIGGDFYDVIEVGPRAWGIVVGDVCGRGPDAAALTGLMRHSVRTAVVRESVPSRVLAQTNDAVLDQIDDARFCTAAYLRLELDVPSTGQVRMVASSAGHPRPVVLRSNGRAELVDCSGLLLGVVPQPTLIDVELVLEPGDAVILYTDGVTEARVGPELFGERRLLERVRSLAGRDAEGLAAGLDDAVRRFQDDANDDVAILVARVAPSVP